jgi:hypothetical protein
MAQPATVLLLTRPLCWLLWREWRALSPAGGRASVRMQRALTAPEARPGVPHKRRP